jgi:hypothetical protein
LTKKTLKVESRQIKDCYKKTKKNKKSSNLIGDQAIEPSRTHSWARKPSKRHSWASEPKYALDQAVERGEEVAEIFSKLPCLLKIKTSITGEFDQQILPPSFS